MYVQYPPETEGYICNVYSFDLESYDVVECGGGDTSVSRMIIK